MTVVKKKSQKVSVADLVTALDQLIFLLEGQKEVEAVQDLRIVCQDLQKFQPASEEFRAAISLLFEAFTGEHELEAYTIQRSGDSVKWTEAEQLYVASTTVLSLAKRFGS